MDRFLTLILGDRFPSGLLALAGLLVLWVDVSLGLTLLFLAIGWNLWQSAVLSYGSRDGRPVVTTIRFLILLVSWGGLVYVTYDHLG